MSKLIIAALRYTPLLAAFLIGYGANDYLDTKQDNRTLMEFAKGFKEINDLYQPQLDALPIDKRTVPASISSAINSVPKPTAKPKNR